MRILFVPSPCDPKNSLQAFIHSYGSKNFDSEKKKMTQIINISSI